MYRSFLLLLLFSTAILLSLAQEDLVNCTLCVDQDAIPNDPDARFNLGTETLSCQQIYERGVRLLPEDNCTAFQNIGRFVCLCEGEAPTTNNCTLCADGSLPIPRYEGLPGETCAELQVDAQRDSSLNCLTWQGTVGVWCGCENNVVANELACRLCGADVLLPDPLDVKEDGGPSCGLLEFNASLPGADCSVYQNEYSEYCCRNVVPPPTTTTTTTTSGVVKFATAIAWILSTLVSFLLA
jgi:hypothetical protein